MSETLHVLPCTAAVLHVVKEREKGYLGSTMRTPILSYQRLLRYLLLSGV